MGRCSRRQTNLAVFGVDAQDAKLHLLAKLSRVLRLVDPFVGQFRNVAEPFQIVAQFDESTEGGKACDSTFHQVSGFVRRHEIVPRIGFQVLNGKRHAPILGIDAGDDGLYLLSLLQNLSRMLDAARP